MNDSVSKTEAREQREERNETFVSFFSRTRQRGDHPLSLSHGNLSLSNQNKERSNTSLRSSQNLPHKRGGKNVKKTNLQSCLLQRDQSSSRAFAGFVHLPVRPLPDLFELFVALVDRGRVTHGLTSFSDTENRKDVCVCDFYEERERLSCFLSKTTVLDGFQNFLLEKHG